MTTANASDFVVDREMGHVLRKSDPTFAARIIQTDIEPLVDDSGEQVGMTYIYLCRTAQGELVRVPTVFDFRDELL